MNNIVSVDKIRCNLKTDLTMEFAIYRPPIDFNIDFCGARSSVVSRSDREYAQNVRAALYRHSMHIPSQLCKNTSLNRSMKK